MPQIGDKIQTIVLNGKYNCPAVAKHDPYNLASLTECQRQPTGHMPRQHKEPFLNQVINAKAGFLHLPIYRWQSSLTETLRTQTVNTAGDTKGKIKQLCRAADHPFNNYHRVPSEGLNRSGPSFFRVRLRLCGQITSLIGLVRSAGRPKAQLLRIEY